MENSIEEDIEIALDKFSNNKDIGSAIFIVEKFVLGNYILRGGRTNIVKNSLRYILSDYKRVLKENEELKDTNCLVKRYFKLKDTNTYLQKENDELKKQRNIEPILINNKMYFIDNEIYNELLEDIKSNYTSVQKVKDKIEKLNDESHAEELEDIMNRKNYTITELVQYVLQELLEGRK